jgi:hypothetical protein
MRAANDHHVLVEAVDAVELIEIVEFLCGWFRRDHTTLEHSLSQFSPDYGLSDLKRDLQHFGNQLSQAHILREETRS